MVHCVGAHAFLLHKGNTICYCFQGNVPNPDAKVTYSSEQAFVDIITGRMSIVNAYFKQKFAVSNAP